MSQRFSHVAVTVEPELLAAPARGELLSFYQQVMGWEENVHFAIPGQRILLRAPNDAQYLTIRSSEAPMATSGYEHLGVAVDSEAELRAVYGRAERLAPRYPELELGPVQCLYDGSLLTFRLRYRLPLTLELQYLSS